MSLSLTHPPPLPPDNVYTSCYCEENIYLLAQAFSPHAEDPDKDKAFSWNVFVVFISNDHKMVALWNQKSREDVVVWDYHVILVLRPAAAKRSSGDNLEAWVYDFDSRLPMPCTWLEYMSGTFPYTFQTENGIDPRYTSSFRVIPSPVFLDHFASDRSHMVREVMNLDGSSESNYVSPPPSYPPICGRKAKDRGIGHNLMTSFVSMSTNTTNTPSLAHDVFRDYVVQMADGGTEGEVAIAQADELHSETLADGSMEAYGEVMDIAAFVKWLGFH